MRTIFYFALGVLLLLSSAHIVDAQPMSYPPSASARQGATPITVSIPIDKDTYAASGSQWADNPRGSSMGLYVGYGDASAFNLEKTRIFLHFDSAGLAQAKVFTATLRLYLTFTTFEHSGQLLNAEVHKVTEPWEETTLTWNRQPQYDAALQGSAAIGTDVGRWIEWRLPVSLVQDWIDHPENNFGIALVAPVMEDPGKHVRNFTSREYQSGASAPQLVIEYEVKTPTPTLTPTSTSTPPATPTATPRPPRLELSLSNSPMGPVRPDGLITYTIQYKNTGGEDLTGVVITGSIPANTSLVDKSPNSTPVAAKLQWVIGTVAVGAQGARFYMVQVNGATTFSEAFYSPLLPAAVAPPPTPTMAPISRRGVATPAADKIKEGEWSP